MVKAVEFWHVDFLEKKKSSRRARKVFPDGSKFFFRAAKTSVPRKTILIIFFRMEDFFEKKIPCGKNIFSRKENRQKGILLCLAI